MKRLLALVSILKLKRMKAKPLKRHCIFQRDKNLSDRAAKEPDGFLKKIAIMAFNFSFIFPLKPGSLRAEKYSLNEMKNLNRLLELIRSNQGWKSKRDTRKQAKRTYPMFNGHSSVPMQSLLAFCFSSCGNTVLFWDDRRKNCFSESLCLAFYSMSTTRCEHQPSRPSFHDKMSQYR